MIFLDRTGDESDTSILAEEERGEIAFAVRTAESLLKWMGMTVEDAKKAVEDHVAYYLGGDERVEIPAAPEGSRDVIFPYMDGVL